jgi:polyribonucleotide nucleotidyltransferase
MNKIYENLFSNMNKKLSEKVQHFLQTKQTEIHDWGVNEIQTWNQQLDDLIHSLEQSLVQDSQRQLQRDRLHTQAQSWRDFSFTNSIEEIEKETTRKQILEAKRLGNTEKAIDSRMLQVSIPSLPVVFVACCCVLMVCRSR